jgi:hypothetical protein
MDVHAGRMLDVAAALVHIDLRRRDDVHFTLRSLLVHRQQDLAVFDAAFRLFWRAPGDQRRVSRRGPEPGAVGLPQVVPAAAELGQDGGEPSSRDGIVRTAPMSYSAAEVLRVKDFGEFTEEELAEVRETIAGLRWDPGRRRTRRWAPGRAGGVDARRIVRRNLPFGGEPLVLPRRRRTWRRRPLVVLCDVSGSMERYARILLQLVASLAGGLERVEAFVFATRLTRITAHLRRGRAVRDVAAIPGRVPDWSGGTRIGEALRAFHVRFGRRVLSGAPVVLLISDGWDRGEPGVLRREISRLRRSCHRLVWLNPLLGSPDYRPLTRGMQAALPFVDDFLPVHNLASLETLAEHVSRLPLHRRRPGVPSPA